MHANGCVNQSRCCRGEERLRAELAALATLAELDPAAIAEQADAVIARLEDSDQVVRYEALETLGKLEPATLAQHADAVIARLEDEDECVRKAALFTLGKLGPAALAQYAFAVVARLEDSYCKVRAMACHTLTMLPRYVRFATRGVDCKELLSRALDHGEVKELRSRLLGRMAWYKCRIRLRVRIISLYWYALLYRPSGPGHTRDVEAWDHMIQELHS